MPEKESFDIDGLMVFRSDLTAVDQNGNIVAGVITPDRYFPSDREPLSGEQTGRYTNTTAYWESHSSIVPSKGDVYIYSDGGSIEQGGVVVDVPKIKVGDGVTSINNLPFTDSDNQGGGTEEVFVCTFASGSMDKTPEQILQAKENGMVVLCKEGTTRVYYCTAANQSQIFFESLYSDNNVGNVIFIIKWVLNSGWTTSLKLLQDKLVSSGNSQNIKTINGNSLLGNGNLTIGSVTIYSGSSAPSSETGSNGDIYIQEVV